MKQPEVWRFVGAESRRLNMVGGSEHALAFCAFAYFQSFALYDNPSIGGVSLKPVTGSSRNLSDSRRQLAAHGKRVEIRRVSK